MNACILYACLHTWIYACMLHACMYYMYCICKHVAGMKSCWRYCLVNKWRGVIAYIYIVNFCKRPVDFIWSSQTLQSMQAWSEVGMLYRADVPWWSRQHDIATPPHRHTPDAAQTSLTYHFHRPSPLPSSIAHLHSHSMIFHDRRPLCLPPLSIFSE